MVRRAARGEIPASHRDGRGAPLARRDDRAYREYLSEEQRGQRGCIARRMQPGFQHGLPTRRAVAVLLALLVWPAVRSSAQTVTVDTVGEALKIRAPGFGFLKGDPLARLKDGRSVRVELAAMVLPAPGKIAGGDDATDLRVELRSLGGTIRRDRRWTRALVPLPTCRWLPPRPGASSSWLFPSARSARSAAICRSGFGSNTASWMATAVGSGGLRLHPAGAHRRVEPPPPTGSSAPRSAPPLEAGPFRLPSRGSSAAAMTRLRNRLIAAFLASTLLPLGATVWITTSLLDRSLGYATTGELDRLSRTLESTAKQFYQRERDALKQDALAGRAAPATLRRRRTRSQWPEADPSVLGERRARALRRVRRRRRARGLHAASGRSAATPGVDVYSRDLGGVSMEQLSTQLRQTRQLVDSIDARDLRRGFTLTLLLLLGAAGSSRCCRWCFIAHRVSRPIQQLTAGLTDFAGGDWSRRLETDAAGHRRRTKWAAPSTRSITWPISSRRTASGSCT